MISVQAPSDEGAGSKTLRERKDFAKSAKFIWLSTHLSHRLLLRKIHLPHQREADKPHIKR